MVVTAGNAGPGKSRILNRYSGGNEMANSTSTSTAADTATRGAGTAVMAAPGEASGVRLTGTAGAVWRALVAAPSGVTVAAIMEASGVSRPTVTKALAELADAGHAVRTPGEGHGRGRTPDLWSPVNTAPTADAATAVSKTDTPDEEDQDGHGPNGDDEAAGVSPDTLAVAMRLLSEESARRTAAAEELRQAQAEEAERHARIDAELRVAAQREETRIMLADLLGVVTTTLAAVAADDNDQVARGMETIARYAGAVRKTTRTPVTRASSTTATRDRSTSSPLRPLVADHLHAHSGKEFTPGEIARVLDRSSGAVANALDTLVAHGVAVLTNEHPRRFQAVNTGSDEAAADTDASDQR